MAVIKKPDKTPRKEESVQYARMFLSEEPAARRKPSVIMPTASKNKPKPPSNDPKTVIMFDVTIKSNPLISWI
jgi:hypothetical protein